MNFIQKELNKPVRKGRKVESFDDSVESETEGDLIVDQVYMRDTLNIDEKGRTIDRRKWMGNKAAIAEAEAEVVQNEAEDVVDAIEESPDELKRIFGGKSEKSKKPKSMTSVLKTLMNKKLNIRGKMYTGREAVARKLLAMALDGDFQALKYIYDRIDGSPSQTVRQDVRNEVRVVSIGVPAFARNALTTVAASSPPAIGVERSVMEEELAESDEVDNENLEGQSHGN